MLEIILLYFLTKSIGVLASKKGLPKGKWKLMTVAAWLLFEIIGMMVGIVLFGKDNIFGLMAFAIVCAFGGYLTVKYILDKKPDQNIEDDINRIGVNDLSP